MKIGIFGGSFNPIHKGHIKIAEESIKELNLDKFYFVPAFKSPFKSKEKYVDVSHRINMINLVKPHKTKVSLFEANRKGTSYTIDTIKYFKNKYPNDELYLIIGSDNVYKLNKWKDIDEISKLTKIIIFKREGNFSKINIKKYNAKLLNNELYDFSSSWFVKGYFQNVDRVVMKYISDNYLYANDILLNMVDAKRHKHCNAVASLAAEYAKRNGLDAKRAWFSGLFHDVTKGMPKQWHRDFLKSKGVEEEKLSDYELHSLSAYYWIKDEYLYEDEEVLNAIKVHTTLSKKLSTLDKIIFAADKLAEGRKFKDIQLIRELILKDFDAGFKKIVQITHNHLVETRGTLSKEQEEIYRKWI